MSQPLEEKRHWDPWASDSVAAAGTQARDPHGVRDAGHAPKKTEEILIAPVRHHRHKSLKGSAILFSVVGNFRLLLKNKSKEVQNSRSNKAGNKNSVIQRCWVNFQVRGRKRSS